MTVCARIPFHSHALAAGVSLLTLLATVEQARAQTAAAPAGDDADAPLRVPAVEVTEQGNAGREGSAEEGYRTSTQSMTPLGKLPLKDTPYSISVTPGELIENSNAHTVTDALRTNPAVASLLVPNSLNSLSRMMIRGFNASDQGEMRDGLVDRSFTYPPLENVERIEVLNGMSGFLYGFSSPGGAINYVSKAPTATPLASVELGNYGGGINFAHADLGGPVAIADDRVAYRFNAYKENGGTFVDGSNQRRSLVSGVADVHLAPDTVLTADIWHQNYLSQGLMTYFSNTTSGTWNSSGFAVPDASRFKATRQYGQDWSYNKSEKTLGGLALRSELNDTFTFRSAYRYGEMWRQDSYVDAQLLNSSGTYTEKATSEPLQFEQIHAAYAFLDTGVDTWMFHHTITAGYSRADYYYKRGNAVTTILGTTTIDAAAGFAQPNVTFGDVTNFQDVVYDNWVIGDHVTLGESWAGLVGLNHAVLNQRGWGPGTTISTSNYDATRDTPSVALIYKPIPAATTYVSYMQGLTAGDSSSSASARNRYQVLAPSVSDQYEIGAKGTIGAIDLTAALFRLDKVNAELDPSDLVYKQDGREIHQGLEFTATGKLTDRLTVIGGFTAMDAFIDKATADPLSQGKIPANVPEYEGRTYAEYALPWVPDLKVTGGADYYGRRPIDNQNTGFLNETVIFNAGLRYEPELYGHKTSINLTVSNLLDTAYWAYYRSGDGLVLGAPQVVSLSVKATW